MSGEKAHLCLADGTIYEGVAWGATGVATGDATVTATFGSSHASALVHVTAGVPGAPTGLSATANAASVNLAARAMDGSQLYVRTFKEQPTGGVTEEVMGPTAPGPTAATKPGGIAISPRSPSAVRWSACHSSTRATLKTSSSAAPCRRPSRA